MLPLRGDAALYFRYRRSDPNLRPGRASDVMLWIAFAAFLVVDAWSVFTVFTRRLLGWRPEAVGIAAPPAYRL